MTTEYILPCIENALVDVEERVVVRAVQCLTTLVQLGLLSSCFVVDTVKNVVPLLLHPSGETKGWSNCVHLCCF